MRRVEIAVALIIVAIVLCLLVPAILNNTGEARLAKKIHRQTPEMCREVAREFVPAGTYQCGSISVGSSTIPQMCHRSAYDHVTIACQADGGTVSFTRTEKPRG